MYNSLSERNPYKLATTVIFQLPNHKPMFKKIRSLKIIQKLNLTKCDVISSLKSDVRHDQNTFQLSVISHTGLMRSIY